MRFEFHDGLAGIMLIALAVYSTTGGADFGGGFWDLFAAGPRAKAQRRLIEQALAPVWEANHVWLIFVVVVLFSAFPPAFAALSIALHVPLSLVLLGIVLRGAGFVFRQYGEGTPLQALRWGRVFAVASIIAPFFLGTALAAVSGGHMPLLDESVASETSAAWYRPFALLSGAFVVALFAFLAAVYLIIEAKDEALAEDFRRRALASGMTLGALSIALRMGARLDSPHFEQALLGAWWSNGVQTAVAFVAVGALICLYLRRYRAARALAIAQALGIVLGWGLAQYPFVIAPVMTLQAAAAPKVVLQVLFPLIVVGSALLLPCLVWLMRIFKRSAREAA